MNDISSTETLIGLPALEAAAAELAVAGLRTPPVLHTLLPHLRHVDGDVCTTADADLTNSVAFLERAANPNSPDELAFGHTGHGVQSWWFCVRLLTSSLAVLVYLAHGGIASSEEADCNAVNLALLRLEELIVATDQAPETLVPPQTRLVVVQDDTAESFCSTALTGRHATDDPFVKAFALLNWPPDKFSVEVPDDD